MSVGRSARRVLIVCVATAAVGAIGMGPAAAASTDNGGPLGLGNVVNGLTGTVQNITAPLTGPTAAQPSVVASAAQSDSLAGLLESLPILGPVLTPVVRDLPILGGGSDSSGSKPSGAGSAAPSAPAAGNSDSVTVHRSTSPKALAPGSTWTMNNTAATAPAKTEHGGGGGGITGALSSAGAALGNLVPTSAAGKAEVGVAAVALIILGGVAVAGAAGAAGAAGRRQFVGGPW